MDAKILLVDDEPMVADVVERYLRREGFSVLLAADGEAAVAAARDSAPDLIHLFVDALAEDPAPQLRLDPVALSKRERLRRIFRRASRNTTMARVLPIRRSQ